MTGKRVERKARKPWFPKAAYRDALYDFVVMSKKLMPDEERFATFTVMSKFERDFNANVERAELLLGLAGKPGKERR